LLYRQDVDPDRIVDLWHEVADRYSESHRFYHTLEHIRSMVTDLESYPAPVEDRDALLFSIFFHDLVYRVGRRDNEIRSADLFRERMSATPYTRIEKVCGQIVATRLHRVEGDADTNLLLDLDLAIFGYPEKDYQRYTAQIREEHRLIPELIFRPARRRVLSRFLGPNHIYKTDRFRERYEEQARLNLEAELDKLRLLQ